MANKAKDIWAEKLNKAFSVFRFGKRPECHPKEPYLSFGLDVHIIGHEDIEKFEDYIDALYEESFKETLSRKEMRSQFVTFARKMQTSNFLSREECNVLWRVLEAMPIEEHQVLRDFYGVSLGKKADPLTLGPFTIYDWKRHKERISAPTFGEESVWDDDADHNVLIEYRARTRDADRAAELAEMAFARFENFLYFVIGVGGDRYRPRVVSSGAEGKLRHTYVFNKNHWLDQTRFDGPGGMLPLDDEFFSSPSPALVRLLDMFTNSKSELQRKMMTSVDWMGQAIAETDPANACIKAATALEVLFCQNEKAVINASILSQISEHCAHILGTSSSSALRIEKTIKRLYAVRSSVVHSGSSEVTTKGSNELLLVARSAIVAMIDKPEFRGMNRLEEVLEQLRVKRYRWLDGIGGGSSAVEK